uniref:Spartin-like n=1 Tax=Hirondellea gigas TaxID=1518452 RepID=A0A2P2I2L0_9CRUS
MSEAPCRPPRSSDAPPITAVTALTEAEEFERCYKDAYSNIDRAITLVTENKHEQASSLFEAGLQLLDEALAHPVASLASEPDDAQRYSIMQVKMRATRKEVLQHFASSQLVAGATGSTGYPVPDAPPSYQDCTAGEPTSRYPQLPNQETTPSVSLPSTGSRMASLSPATGGQDSHSPVVTPVMSPREGQLLFRIESGVQIFFIYPDGRVTSPSYPSFLEIVTFNEPLPVTSGQLEGGATSGFLQVGEWSYPLVRATSPVLHSFYGAYMFPDLTNSVPGSHVGVIIPDTISKDECRLFESILTQMTSYKEQPYVSDGVEATESTTAEGMSRSSTSEKIAAGLVSGAEAVSTGVVWGAGKMSKLISQWADQWQEGTPPAGAPDPAQPKTQIDPRLQTTARAARVVSGQAVKVSSYILGQIGKATVCLGRTLAPHIQHHGTRAFSSITGQSHTESASQVDGVMEVASGAIRGASTVYIGLEKAAQTLAVSLTDSTVKVVTHKYGAEAGQLTDNTMYAVGQSAMAGYNIASLGVKGVAKKAAKDTGKALVHHHREKKEKTSGAGREQVEDGMELGEEAVENDDFVMVEEGTEATEHKRSKSKESKPL